MTWNQNCKPPKHIIIIKLDINKFEDYASTDIFSVVRENGINSQSSEHVRNAQLVDLENQVTSL